MKRKISIGASIALMLIGAAITFQLTYVYVGRSYDDKITEINNARSDFQKLANVDEIVRELYVKDIDETKLSDMIIKGYIAGLNDKYSSYLTKEEYAEYTASFNGEVCGIGINVSYNKITGEIYVYDVVKDSPADKAGIKIGDMLYKVGDEYVSDIGLYSAANKIKGNAGTAVTISVMRDEKEYAFTVERASVHRDSVSYKMISDSIGYIAITQFDLNAAELFKTAVDSLISSGAKALLFDVRNNPGGDYNAVCDILDYLLPEGPIVRTYKKDGTEDGRDSDANEIKLPMAVITNSSSASASELFTAALKDYKKARSFGTTTYGKGTVQSVYKLPDLSALIISSQLYCPPFSENFEGKGVTPDETVELSDEKLSRFYFLNEDEDDQLVAARNYLETAIAKK